MVDIENSRPAWVEINLSNLDANLKEIRRVTGGAEIIAIVKGNAYGHGAVATSKVFLDNGVKYLAVATIEEGMELREAGITTPILMLGLVPDCCCGLLVEGDLTALISTVENARALSAAALQRGKTADFMLAVDTGMNRIGFMPTEEHAKQASAACRLPGLRLAGVMSHFASADAEDLAYTRWQLEQFHHFNAMLTACGVKIPLRSIANSPALFRMPEAYLEAVRPGCMMWGVYPPFTDPSVMLMLPVMTVKAKIIHIKTVPAGSAISYGGKFITRRPSVIATLPLGYADGYTRVFQGDRIRALVRGEYAPVLGTICMDQCMIDVTDIAGVQAGDEAVLLGRQGEREIGIQELCDLSGLCSGEIFYGFSKRLPQYTVS